MPKFLSDILAKAGLTVDGVVTLNNTATGQTPASSDNSTKLATTAWVRGFVTPYTLPIASTSTLGGIKIGTGLAIDGTGVVSVAASGVGAIRALQQFTATSGQTVFTVSGGYTPGLIDIFLNGVLLTPTAVTSSNGTTFTLADPATAGDLLDVFVYNPIYNGFISSTDQVPEGTTNLYFTTDRARASVSGTTGRITYSAGQFDLATTGVTAGTYGSSTAIPTIAVDAYGRITSISTTAVQIVTNLAGLTDVTLSTLSNGQVLFYNSSTSKWENATLSSSFVTEGTNQYYTDAKVETYLSSNGYLTNSAANLLYLKLTGGTLTGDLIVGPNSATGNSGITLTRNSTSTAANIYYQTSTSVNWSIGVDDSTNSLKVKDGSGNTRIQVFNTSGNIGINTTSDPGYKLNINGNLFVGSGSNYGFFSGSAATNVKLELSSTTSNSTIRFINTSTTAGTATTFGISGNTFQWFWNGAEIVRLYGTNGNLLLGTSTDNGYKLDVNGSANISGILSIRSTTSRSTYINGGNTTDAQDNLAIGSAISNTGQSITSGTMNILIGAGYTQGAGYAVTSGQQNILIGRLAGSAITTEVMNTAIGSMVMDGLKGAYNVAIGVFAGRTTVANTTLNNKLFVGTRVNNVTQATLLYGDFETGQLKIGYQSGDASTLTLTASAQLEVTSTTRGFLPPRMTEAQRTAISSPATGLIVYQTDGTEGLYIKLASGWKGLVVA